MHMNAVTPSMGSIPARAGNHDAGVNIAAEEAAFPLGA